MARNHWRDLLLLTALCWGIYCIGLTTHGLTNWQEAQRALVAREMQARQDWIVPTVNGRPYLAKPPMIYWAQLSLAEIRGGRTGEFELRLTVALAGWLGVLATYAAGRRLERAALRAEPLEPRQVAAPGEASWWAALFLATGILYTRSSRIGELDILLVPFTAVAIASLHAAWRSHLDHHRTHFAAVAVAVLAASGAMLTKGPPGLLAIGLGAYGAMAIWYAQERREGSRALSRVLAALGAIALPAAALAINGPPRVEFDEISGVLLFALTGGASGWVLGGLLQPRPAGAVFKAYSRTHPLAVLGIPFLALWGWGRLVAGRVGQEALDTAVRTEAADNLRALVLASPLRNLSASSFGVGLGGVMAAAALVWILRRRVRLSPELAVLIAWVVGGLIAFSMLGKGVGRYLTPVWPGIALLGGVWWARMLAHASWRKPARRLAMAAILVLAVAQSWWYAWGQERYQSHRSPRAFITELLGHPDVDANQLTTLGFDHPAINYYAGVAVPSLEVPGPEALEAIFDLRTATLLMRESELDGRLARTLEHMEAALEPIPLASEFRIDNGKSRIIAARIRPTASGGASPPAPSAGSDPPE